MDAVGRYGGEAPVEGGGPQPCAAQGGGFPPCRVYRVTDRYIDSTVPTIDSTVVITGANWLK
jgi:hypothetical protein